MNNDWQIGAAKAIKRLIGFGIPTLEEISAIIAEHCLNAAVAQLQAPPLSDPLRRSRTMSEKQIVLYGSSDDLVEVEGAVGEEFNGYSKDDDHVFYLAVSDGSAFSVKYDGCWRFRRIAAGSAKMTKVDADENDKTGSRADGKPWYSDIVTLTGDNLTWVILGDGCATATPLRRKAR